jgi:hypothetical protein
MKNIFSHLLHKVQKRIRRGQKNERLERGQVLVIVALSVIALTAIVGLVVDVGLLYLNHGKLRRAVDAAALAATAQFREGYDPDQMAAAAREFLVLNGINDPTAIVETSKDSCDTTPKDPVLCTEPPRKLVRVRATSVINLAFMPVIGIHEATISAQAVSEAASMDVVFVIDASDSMTYDALPDDPLRDPAQCNLAHDCHPFEEVKAAAKAFVGELYMPYDRVSIVTFDDGARADFSFADYDAVLPKDSSAAKRTAVLGAIESLGVVEPDICDTESGPCRVYKRYDDCLGGAAWAHGNCNSNPKDEAIINEDGNGFGDFYLGFDCPVFHATSNPDTCGTTAIGKGLLVAGDEFSNEDTFRQEALWVVILLTDGAANGPSFTCPNSTWLQPFCRDTQLSRHCQEGDTSCVAKGGVENELAFDADDYTRTMSDFLAEEQDVLIFTIGLGDLVRTSVPRASISDPTVKCSEDPKDPIENCYGAGELVMQYAADVGRGKYYFAPTGDELNAIFLEIAQNLATRLTQ